MDVVGHRGCKGLEPENTLLAFRRGIELGCDYVETDVRMTKDSRLVIMHDEAVDRTTNGSGRVGELTFDQIRTLDAGDGEQVPTLTEVLEVTEHNIQLACEIKDGEALADTVRAVLEAGLEDHVVFASFDSGCLEGVHKIRSSLRVAKSFSTVPEDFISIAKALGAEAICIEFTKVNEDMIRTVHGNGLKIRLWCPNTTEDIQKAIDLGSDGIGSDYPDRVLQMLGRA